MFRREGQASAARLCATRTSRWHFCRDDPSELRSLWHHHLALPGKLLSKSGNSDAGQQELRQGETQELT
jgi:hypothetical protein